MRGSCGFVLAIPALVLVAVLCNGCSTPTEGNRWSRHFDSDVWGGALGEQVRRPDRLVPEATLFATIPFAFIYDSDIQKKYEDHDLDPTAENIADALQVVIPAVSLTFATVDWAHGDGGRNFEVMAESLGGVVVVQQVLAHTIARVRPNHDGDNTSFPSGHSSWTFAATTLIVRNLHDPSDDSFHAVDAAIYIPAIFGAWERVAINKHWTSDVACGAFLGVFFTNWVWDAHFGSEEETRPTIFSEDHGRGIAWKPSVDLIDGRVAFGISGGF